LTPILTSVFFAYLFYPVYSKINKKIKKQNVSAFLVTFFILILIIIPAAFMMYQLSYEVQVNYILAKQKIVAGGMFNYECSDGMFCSAYREVGEYFAKPEVKLYMQEGIDNITKGLSSKILEFLYSLPKRILDIFITFFMIFFLLIDGKKLIQNIEKSVPLDSKHRKMIFKKMHEVTHAVIYGFIIMAIAQAIIAMAVFGIFGVASPIFWGIMVGVFALIPLIGSSVIYIPMVIFKFLDGDIVGAIGVMAGGIFISLIDTFLKPKILGDKSDVHPVLMILGLVGGIQLLGPIGFIFGPVILALLVTFFRMYIKSVKG